MTKSLTGQKPLSYWKRKDQSQSTQLINMPVKGLNMEKKGIKWRSRVQIGEEEKTATQHSSISVWGLPPLVNSATIRENLIHIMNILISDTSITQVVVTGLRLSEEEGGSRSN